VDIKEILFSIVSSAG